MGEARGVVRVNVSVPKALKARMDAAEGRVNWSAIASRAFQAELLRLGGEREATKMDDVIARLKAADELDREGDYQEGREAGDRWARGHARPKQLRALAKLEYDDPGHDLAAWVGVYSGGGGCGAAWGLYCAMHGVVESRDADRADVEAFWEKAVRDGGVARADDPDFALGFAKGALDVWDKAEDKL